MVALWDVSYRGLQPPPTNAPAARLRGVHMSLPMLDGVNTAEPAARRVVMEMLAAMPDWLVWCAATAAGALALKAVVNVIEAALDLEAS